MAEFIKYFSVSQFIGEKWVSLIDLPVENQNAIDPLKSSIEDLLTDREMVCLMSPTESIIINPKLGPVKIVVKSKIKHKS